VALNVYYDGLHLAQWADPRIELWSAFKNFHQPTSLIYDFSTEQNKQKHTETYGKQICTTPNLVAVYYDMWACVRILEEFDPLGLCCLSIGAGRLLKYVYPLDVLHATYGHSELGRGIFMGPEHPNHRNQGCSPDSCGWGVVDP